jgi:membrane protein implicated in regulation of membrane protease activity
VTLERKYHVVAISLLVLGIAAGAVSWKLSGTPFWVTVGMALLLVIAGLVFAGKAGSEERKRKEGLD